MRTLLLVCLLPLAAPGAPPKSAKKPKPAAPGPAETEGSFLARARELSRAFEFEAALTQLEFARARRPSVAELVEIETLTALAWAALDDVGKSAKAFAALLTLQPDFALAPGVSPKVRDAFAQGRALWEANQPVALEAARPVAGDDGTVSFEVKVTSGERKVAEVTLAFRLADGPVALEQVGLLRSAPAVYGVKLPPLRQGEARRSTLEYSIQARDVAGSVLATVGTREAPERVEVQVLAGEARPAPITSSWVFWTVVGVVAVGAAVGTPLAVNALNTPAVPQGSLGQVQLR